MIIPEKLKSGDEVRVIAPSRSMSILGSELKDIANKRLAEMGFKVSFGKNIDEIDDFKSSSIRSRVEDLHDAFMNTNVKGILAVIGGFNSNQILDYLDWNIIANNPKILCGFSDITILNNAIYAKTGLVTYSGPHYSSFGQKFHFDYTRDYFNKCCAQNQPFDIQPSGEWSDDQWYKDQDNRTLEKNAGFLVINEGKAEGTIIGGNICTFNLLQGAQYFPSLANSVLFVEDDAHADGTDVVEFDRNLQSLIQLPEFKKVKGVVIGRFQKSAAMTDTFLTKIIKTKRELKDMPVVAGVDFGHTDPKITIPIGGIASLDTTSKTMLRFLKH